MRIYIAQLALVLLFCGRSYIFAQNKEKEQDLRQRIENEKLNLQGLSTAEVAQFLNRLAPLYKSSISSSVNESRKVLNELVKVLKNDRKMLELYARAFLNERSNDARETNKRLSSWLGKNRELLRNEDFMKKLRLHLYYMSYALRATEASNSQKNTMLSEYFRLIDSLKVDVYSGGGNGVGEINLHKPLNQSHVAKFFGISERLASVSAWEQKPGNISGMYNKTILPYYREHEREKLLEIWKSRLLLERNLAKHIGKQSKLAQFEKIYYPKIKVEAAKEYFNLGKAKEGLVLILKIIEQNPEHPLAGSWILMLKKNLDDYAKALG